MLATVIGIEKQTKRNGATVYTRNGNPCKVLTVADASGKVSKIKVSGDKFYCVAIGQQINIK